MAVTPLRSRNQARATVSIGTKRKRLLADRGCRLPRHCFGLWAGTMRAGFAVWRVNTWFGWSLHYQRRRRRVCAENERRKSATQKLEPANIARCGGRRGRCDRYMMRTEEGLVVKRLGLDEEGRWEIRSDSPDWRITPMSPGTEIIGEVRWSAVTY